MDKQNTKKIEGILFTLGLGIQAWLYTVNDAM